MGLHDHHLVGASTPVHFDSADRPGRLRPDRHRRGSRTPCAEATAITRRATRRRRLRRSWRGRSRSTRPRSTLDERKYREVEKGVYPELFGSPDQKSSTAYLFRASHATQLRPYRPLWALAEQVAGGAKSPYAAAVALERYFRVGGGFIYDQHPPRAAGVPPLVDFVTRTHRGYCQHFSGAMALMLRYLGIPARVAAGFTSGRYDKRQPRVGGLRPQRAHMGRGLVPRLGLAAVRPDAEPQRARWPVLVLLAELRRRRGDGGAGRAPGDQEVRAAASPTSSASADRARVSPDVPVLGAASGAARAGSLAGLGSPAPARRWAGRSRAARDRGEARWCGARGT